MKPAEPKPAPVAAVADAVQPQQPAGKKGKKWRPKPQPIPPRLPDGAVFHVTYNAATETWSGTLTVAGQTFSGEKSGVFKLLQLLDQQYRASVQPGCRPSPIASSPRRINSAVSVENMAGLTAGSAKTSRELLWEAGKSQSSSGRHALVIPGPATSF